MAENSPMKKWLSVEELAHYLGIRKSTVYSYVAERRVPFHKIPGSQITKFKLSEIDAWMETGRVQTRDEYKAEQQGKGGRNGKAPQKEGPGR